MTTTPGRKHRVVVIGSGFGGLFGTQALKRRDDVEIILVAKTAHHLFQPLLYQVATGILSEGEVAPSTREVLARQKNARVVLGEVTHIDLEARTVTSELLGRTSVTPYDSLLVAAGSGQSWFGNDHFADMIQDKYDNEAEEAEKKAKKRASQAERRGNGEEAPRGRATVQGRASMTRA